MVNNKKYYLHLYFALGLIALLGFNISMGSISIPYNDLLHSIFDKTHPLSPILWQFRIPKAITCVLAGAALGASGLLMQTLFRNPLAGPDVLGLSSGASLFVALLLMSGNAFIGFPSFIQPWSVAIAATIGSGIVFFLVLAVARKIPDNASLLIIGLMVAAVVSSVVGVLQFLSRADDLQAFMIWSLGSVGSTEWPEIAVLAVVVIIAIGISLTQLKATDSLLLGDNYAKSLGIQLKKSRFWIVTATSLMTGVVTAFCGPIAFVGLAVPHLVRMVTDTTSHRILLPQVMMAGAMLLLVCDSLAQLPGRVQLLPLNAVTSLLGAPVVIWVVLRNKKLRL